MPSSRWIDVGIAVAAFAGSLAMLAAGTGPGDGVGEVDALTIGLTALASLPLAARRRSELAVFVITALASTVLYAVAQPAGPPLGPTVALYWLAAEGEWSRGRIRLTLSLVVTLLIAHVTASGIAADRFPGTELGFAVLVWGGVWLAGDRTRLRQERMAALEERAARAEREAENERRLAAAEERSRIARDLHDSAGHAINVILVHAGLGRLRSAQNRGGGGEEFATIEQVARETVGEIDQLVGALREDGDRADVEPPAGLAALRSLADTHRAAGMDVAVDYRGDRRSLPASVDRTAYRLLQESLTNAARHGDGSAVVVVGFGESALELTVTNPLRAGATGLTGGGGHGLIGMRERAALLGGSLQAGARDGAFEVHARLPYDGGRQ